jgi:hypothetical protein
MTHFGYLASGKYGHDAGIFAQAGSAMKDGRIMYTEVWENKGPLLYFINMLGVSIDYYHGIFYLEFLALFIALLFGYKTALFITNKNSWIAVLCVMFSMLLLAVTLQGGNLSEEYALPFMCVALYYVTKFFYNDFILKKYEVIIFGMCFSAAFLLRANICAFFIPMILIVAYHLIRQKQWKSLLNIFSFSLLGMFVFAMPFLIYLIYNNALVECINIAYLNGLSQFSPLPMLTLVQNVYDMLKSTAMTGTLYAALAFIVFYLLCRIKKLLLDQSLKYMLDISFWGLILNLIANSLSGANHMHYFMTFIPILIVPAAWIFHSGYQLINRVARNHYVSNLAIMAVVLFISLNGLLIMGYSILHNISNKKAPVFYTDAEYIVNNSDSDDLVQVIGGDVTLNYLTQRHTASRHIHFAGGRFSNESIRNFANEIANDIYQNVPKFVLFGSEERYEYFCSMVTDFNFEELMHSNYEQVLIDNDFWHLVFKLKS